jgi:hypothetical protein
MDEQEILEKIVEKINTDPEGMQRFLQANPYTHFDIYNLHGIINEIIFLSFLYCENEETTTEKTKLISILQNGGVIGKNTIFILGSQGCGKTTLLNVLLKDSYAKGILRGVKIDCDRHGVNGKMDSLKIIFLKSLMSFIKGRRTSFDTFISFFNVNTDILMNLLGDYSKMLKFKSYLSDLKSEKTIDSNCYEDCFSWLDEHCGVEDLFYLIVIFSFSSYFDETGTDAPILISVDNLDSIDEYDHLKLFIDTISNISIQMSGHFHELYIHKDRCKKYRYADKIKIIIAMRETTRAALSNTHFSDVFRALYTYCDITEWYDKVAIVNKRLGFLEKSSKLSIDKQTISKFIRKIVSDKYTNDIFIPLFNNSYRKTTSAITEVICNNTKYLNDYECIMDLSRKNKRIRHGARGIILRLLIDEFAESQKLQESIFNRIGVPDLTDPTKSNKNDDINVARVILSYLSNYTETTGDSEVRTNGHKLSILIKDFEKLFPPQEIIQFVKNMYDLKDSTWTHLVTFSQLKYTKESSSDEKHISDESTLYYSCAGKIYLEMITTHFEFFSSRLFKRDGYPLFCEKSRNKENGEYNFVAIIERVFTALKRRCMDISIYNKKVCVFKNYPDPYSVSNNIYLNSHHIAKIKNFDKTPIKQFHEERMIHAHIGYIDTFRIFILNLSGSQTFESEKIKINQILHGLLKQYVNLLDIVLVSNVKLLARYKRQLDEIQKDFTNFGISLNKYEKDVDEE